MRVNHTISNAGKCRAGLLAFAVLLLAGRAGATGILYQFNNVFSGNVPPGGPAPWIDATFQTQSNGVQLTINNAGLSGGEFLSELDFNLNPNYSASAIQGLQFGLVASNGNFGASSIVTGEDIKKADGDGYYDINFNFNTASAGQFGAGDYLVYLITGITGLTASDFAFLSSPGGGHGPYYAAAHIQGISGGNSVWVQPSNGPVLVPVPEPPAWALLVASIGLWGAFHFRKHPLRGSKL